MMRGPAFDARWQIFVTEDPSDSDPHMWIVCGACSLSSGIAFERSVPYDLAEFFGRVTAFKADHADCGDANTLPARS